MDYWDRLRDKLPEGYARALYERLVTLGRKSGTVTPPAIHVSRGKVVASEWPSGRFQIGRKI